MMMTTTTTTMSSPTKAMRHVRSSSSAVALGRKNAALTSRRTRAARRKACEVHASAEETVKDTIIVGGGVSGLSTAFTMKSKNASCDVVVTEIRDRVGGNVTSMNDGTYIWEEGPNSYQPGDAVLKLACDAGMKDDIVLANPDSDRYVLWDGELRLPKDIPTAVLGDF